MDTARREREPSSLEAGSETKVKLVDQFPLSDPYIEENKENRESRDCSREGALNETFESSGEGLVKSGSHPILFKIREKLESQRMDANSPGTPNGRRKRVSANLVKDSMIDELVKAVEELEIKVEDKGVKLDELTQNLHEQEQVLATTFVKNDTLQSQVQCLRENLDETTRLKNTAEIENLKLKNALAQAEQKLTAALSKVDQFKADSQKLRMHRSNSYTSTVPLTKRLEESTELATKYPNCVPIILEPPAAGTAMAKSLGFDGKLLQRKLLLSGDMDFKNCCVMMRQHLERSKAIKPLTAKDALYFFVNNDFSTILMNEKLSAIYDVHKHPDGFLYMHFAAENTFG